MSIVEDIRLIYQAGFRLLPEHMHDGVTRYMERGIEPGSFLFSMLRGETARAMQAADPANKACKEEWLTFLTDCLPIKAHGSPHLVASWMKQGGLSGLPDGQ